MVKCISIEFSINIVEDDEILSIIEYLIKELNAREIKVIRGI